MMDANTWRQGDGDRTLESAWLTEQISRFEAAVGVKVQFTPGGLGEANLRHGLAEFCSVGQSEDGPHQAVCRAWHECQAQVIMRSTRAVRLRCPMGLDYFWAPVSKDGTTYGSLYSEPVLQAGRTAGNGSMEPPQVIPRMVARRRRSLRVETTRSDGVLFLLELMGQRLGARFHQERHLPVPLDPSEALVRRAEAVLCGTYHEKISTRDIAEELHVSESHLCHAFHRVTGGTLGQRLNELRFQEACRLLKEHPRLSVGEVAFAAGFQSLSRFSEQFRRRKMPSPGKWRQANGG